MKAKVKNVIPKVQNIAGDFSIDFSSGFQLSDILLNYGGGNRSINGIGEGSKKRLFLAIMEWDREIRVKEAHKRIIRGYDEPDASLHYQAQKEMFNVLKSLSENENANVQPIICTHSLLMIDRTPARSINHIIHNNDISHIDYLKDCGDSEIKEFLDKVSELSGIKNSSLFFERCFLIVEGYTEENALPYLYKKVTGRTLIEDGVVLINIKGNGAWECFLKLLNKNKGNATILFLDKDTQTNAENKVTSQKLEKIGFNKEFITKNVLFVGANEFEDVFSNELFCKCLNTFWPKNAGSTWSCEEVATLRKTPKFSGALMSAVNKYKAENKANYDYCRKPELGKRIGETINKEEIMKIGDISCLLERINRVIA